MRIPPFGRLAAVCAAAVLATAACADRVITPDPRPSAPSAAPRLSSAAGDSVSAFVIGSTGWSEPMTHTADINVPVAPGPWEPPNWSVVRHVRDDANWYKIEPMMAWHGTMCQRPDDAVEPVHHVEEYRDLVFLCRNHLMTAMNASGYGVVYLTPDRMVDLSRGTAVVRFDVATLRESGRDWVDLWVTPYQDNLVTPLDDSLPDLQGEPRRGLHVRMTALRDRSAFEASVIRDHRATRLPSRTTEGYEAAFARRGLAPSATRRDTFELHVSRTRVRFGMPRYNLWWVDAPVSDLGWSLGVVQLGHHSFNPTADGGKPTTWHWDNVGVQPAVPFTIIRADRRFVDASTPNGEVVLARPAPRYAYLRGSGVGVTEVSFAGASGRWSGWRSAEVQRQERYDPTRFSSAWMPVPEGTTRVRFRPVSRLAFLSGGRWMVRDLSVWASEHPSLRPSNDDDEDDD